jgi:hypothetical protein
MIAKLPSLGGQFGMDDWAMVATMVCFIPITVCKENG